MTLCSTWLSTLGAPVHLIAYTADLTQLIIAFRARVQQYTDDVHLFSTCDSSVAVDCLVLKSATDESDILAAYLAEHTSKVNEDSII